MTVRAPAPWPSTTGRRRSSIAEELAIRRKCVYLPDRVYLPPQQTGREYLLAVVQGLFWPAFMVYEVFKALGRRG